MKQRIEYTDLRTARWKARCEGGRIAFQPVTGIIYWYSPDYTMTDIFIDTDSEGEWDIGFFNHFL